MNTRENANPIDAADYDEGAADPRVQLIVAAVDSRFAAVLAVIESLTEVVDALSRVDDMRAEQIAGLYALLTDVPQSVRA